MPMAAATATVSSFQQHFTWRKWKHRKRKRGWKGLDPQRAGLCFPIVLAQLSLCWSRALLQLGPKAAAKEKPRQPSVQEEEGCAGAGVLGRRGEGLVDPQPTSAAPAGHSSCLPWGNGTVLPILSRNHREEAYRDRSEEAKVLESRTSTFSWLWTTAALTKDPEGQGMAACHSQQLHHQPIQNHHRLCLFLDIPRGAGTETEF